MTVPVSGTASTTSASAWVSVAEGSLCDCLGITSSAAGLESRRLVFLHQAKNARRATSARAWVDHDSGVPSGLRRRLTWRW